MTERIFVRNAVSGQLGWLVRKGGRQMVHLDRPPGPNNLVPYREKEWVSEPPMPPLSARSLAQIQFAADTQLARELGQYEQGRRIWASLKDEERIQWMKVGPDPVKSPVRFRLYNAIRIALEGLLDGSVS